MGKKIEIYQPFDKVLSDLKRDPSISIVELFSQLSKEYEEMLDPRKEKHIPSEAWVYYPWSNQLVQICDEKTLWLLRTNRNMLLVSPEELEVLRDTGVLIAGLSVGSSMAIGLAYSGIRGPFYLADFDEISATNLNRLRAPLVAHGKNKAQYAAQVIYELDPFSDVNTLETALDSAKVEEILEDKKIKIMFDEVDDFKLKIDMREAAKKHRIPLIMLTALGDSVLIDIERYDSDELTQPFNGLVSKQEIELARSQPSPEIIKRLSVSIVGKENVPLRAIESLEQMGTTLSGRPQLYGTIAMEGGAAAYLVREIVLGRGPKSGRYKIDLGDITSV